jgi:hypothetical protein
MPRHKRFNLVVKPKLTATGKITSWFVDAGMIDGRRVRFVYATKARAQAKADEMKLAHRQHGDSILNAPITPMSPRLSNCLSLTRQPWSKRTILHQK